MSILFFKDIWRAGLADMQLISICNIKDFYIIVINILRKYTWFVPLNNKKGITITNTFQKVLNESGCKPNKIKVDRGSESYNRPMKSWLMI